MDVTKNIISKLSPESKELMTKYFEHDLRITVIGFGKMGILHSGILNLLKPGIIKAIVDRSLLLTFGASRIINTVKFYRSIDKMLKEIDPDAVYITTPTNSHYPIIKKLLENGVRHIFVEKPPTINYKQLKKLIDIRKPNQYVMIGLQKRYALPFRHAKMLLDNDIIGKVKYVYAYIKSGDILSTTTRYNVLGRGVLLDLGIHLIDLLVWMFNITTIINAEKKSIHTAVEDQFNAKLGTKEKYMIDIEVTWSDPAYRLPETYIEIHGTTGIIKVTEDYLKVETKERHPLLNNRKESTLYKPQYYQGIPPVNLADPEYTIESIHFLQTIYNKKQSITSIESVAESMKLIDALYNKAR